VRVSGDVEKVQLKKCTLGVVDVESELIIEACSLLSSSTCERPQGLTIIHPNLRVLEVDLQGELPTLHVQCPALVRMILSDSTLRHLGHIVLRDMKDVLTDALELRMMTHCPDDATQEITRCGEFA